MSDLYKIKEKIYHQIVEALDQKISTANEAIASAKESRNNDTKSSAGDKYETGRAMMQLEIDKNQSQLSKAENLKRNLQQINLQKGSGAVELGSLVITNQENYFISIGLGKVKLGKDNYYSVSLVSPIGRFLLGKKVGDQAFFQNRNYIIENIV